jgi:Cu/Ag efflux pump CusA
MGRFMSPTSRNRLLLVVALLVPLIALAIAAGFVGYRLLTRPAPAPVILAVVAPFPGASPEEVEQQVTIPLEVTFGATPHLWMIRSQSSFGMAALRLHFDDSTDYATARHVVINRLQLLQPLPAGVAPMLSTVLPGHEVFRYTLAGPAGAEGRPVYTLSDLRALQDRVIKRELQRVPRILDVEGRGGTVKRYEVHPDPNRLRQYGISPKQLRAALANGNGDDAIAGPMVLGVRDGGGFGGGENPLARALGAKHLDPAAAAAQLREEDRERARAIRDIIVTSVNGHDIRLEDVVEGGRLGEHERPGERGVVASARPRGDVALRLPRGEGAVPLDERRVEGVVFLRPGEDAETALRDVRAKLEELNGGDPLLPGVRIEPLTEGGGRPEDSLWMLAEFPRNIAPDRLAESLREVRETLAQQAGVAAVLTETDEPDAQAPLPGSAAVFVLTKGGGSGSRTAGQLRRTITEELHRTQPGIRLTYGTRPPDRFSQAFEAAPGEVVLRLFGRDLDELEQTVARADELLRRMPGVEDVRSVDGFGVPRFACRIDPQKCQRWGVSANDANNALRAALGSMADIVLEGERQLDITIRWSNGPGAAEEAILDHPVEVTNNLPVPAPAPGANPGNPVAGSPRLRLRDLVSPVGEDGGPDPQGQFMRAGFTAIYRENGRRCVAVHFRLRDTSLYTVRDAIAPLIPASCRMEWVER